MKAGRKPLHSEEMETAAREYLADCPDAVPTITGLALHLGVGRATLNAWVAADRGDMQEIAEKVAMLQERKLICNGLMGDFNPAITKMMLTKHGYSDKMETDITTKGQSINTWTVNPVTTDKNA